MRILIGSIGLPGHTNPLLSLGRQLIAEGDEVLWATGPDVHAMLEAAGIRTVQAGPSFGAWFEQLGARTRGVPGGGVPGPRKPHWFVPRLFCEVGAPLMVDDMLAAAREFRPDVVVYDSRCYAAPAVAKAVGAEAVLRAVTTLLPPEVEQLANDAIAPLWDGLGLGTPRLAGAFDGLVLSEWPASLDDPNPYGNLTVNRVAPTPASGHCPDWFPRWIAQQDGRPIVYATMGTSFSAPGPISLLLEALDTDDYAAILTLGNLVNRDGLRPVPNRVRIESYVPQETVLPHCDAVISHGGSGSTLGALAHGLPHVILPQGADQYINAALVSRAGAGIGLLQPSPSVPQLQSAFNKVVRHPSYASRSAVIAGEMHQGLTLHETVELIHKKALAPEPA